MKEKRREWGEPEREKQIKRGKREKQRVYMLWFEKKACLEIRGNWKNNRKLCSEEMQEKENRTGK